MTLRLAIIADDLTGALDAAAAFAAVPGGVYVATRPEALAECPAGAGVVAVSTRSREIAPEEAARRVAAVRAGLPADVSLFKKVDSRLKGPLEAELDAIPGPLLVAPALPEFGRIVAGGAVTGFGVEAPIPVRARLGRHAARAAVPDVATAAEMAAALQAADPKAILVGARGLAVALAAQMGLAPPVAHPYLPRPTVFVVGSVDPITLAQVAGLRRAQPDLRVVLAPSGDVPPCHGPDAAVTLIQTTPGIARSGAEVARHLAQGALPWLDGARGILCTGGATAEALLDALGLSCLRLRGEALPGLPVAEAGGRVIVTKSGGFGDADCFNALLARVNDNAKVAP